MPYCLAMMLCDQVYREPTTKKVSILGAFDSLFLKGPGSTPFCVFFALTDGHGEIKINVKIRHCKSDFSDDQDNEIATPRDGISLNFVDPLQVFEGVFVVQSTFSKAGVYFCELYAGSNRIMFRRLTVNMESGEREQNGN